MFIFLRWLSFLDCCLLIFVCLHCLLSVVVFCWLFAIRYLVMVDVGGALFDVCYLLLVDCRSLFVVCCLLCVCCCLLFV